MVSPGAQRKGFPDGMVEGLILIAGVVVVSALFLTSNRLAQIGRPRRGRKLIKQRRAR
jgi:hypothetical protein